MCIRDRVRDGQNRRAPRTNADRVRALAGDFACPVCQGQSLGESDVPIARTIRSTIRTMVDEGRTDAEVRIMLVERFGEDIDYTPTGRGFTGRVWVLPVLAAAAAVAGLGLAIFRWRSGALPEVDDQGTVLPSTSKVVVAVSVVAVLAGVLVARAAGDRSVSDAITGDIRLSTRTLLAEAGMAAPEEADELYTQVLELQPSNVEALAYRGWLRWRSADRAAALIDLDDAVGQYLPELTSGLIPITVLITTHNRLTSWCGDRFALNFLASHSFHQCPSKQS